MRRISRAALEELQKIADQHGGFLRPKDVVDAARDPQSPLHHYFEWDDRKAAEAYRLEQARMIIRAAVVVLRPEQEQPVRAFVSLVQDRHESGGYRTMDAVMASEELRQRLLQQALRDLVIFRARYRALSELARVFAAIDETLQQAGRSIESVIPA